MPEGYTLVYMAWPRDQTVGHEGRPSTSAQRERERRAAMTAGKRKDRAWPTICYSPEAMLSALGSMKLQSLEPPPTLTTHVPLYERRAGKKAIPAEIVCAQAQPPLLNANIGPFRQRYESTVTSSESESDDSDIA